MSGALTADTTWKSSWNLPVRLVSQVVVKSGATLTMEPGVEVDLWVYYIQLGESGQAGHLTADSVVPTPAIWRPQI